LEVEISDVAANTHLGTGFIGRLLSNRGMRDQSCSILLRTFAKAQSHMSRPNIILTGFMGTGKTTVGRLLADLLGYDFVDTDQMIEARSGQCISEIFREKGEAAFRAMEASVAQELSEKEGLVISTGGRMMLDSANAAVLGKRGRIFCLVATPEEIVQRVTQNSEIQRPLLNAPNPMERVVELLQQRGEAYSRFPQLATSNKSAEELASLLAGVIQADPDLRLTVTTVRSGRFTAED